ncbi:MAG: hypothetical protein UBAL2_85240051 [Leptospirillum rubarum]|jgi:hypothetical protein|nr:MAG: hypothetical protein UBAL2_85240051 [Leptospirillum rubarum]
MTSSKVLQKLRALFKRNSSTPEERKSRPWARLQKQKGQTLLSWGLGDGRTFGILPVTPGDSFFISENGIHLKSESGEHVFGLPDHEEENRHLGEAIENVLRKKMSLSQNASFAMVLGLGAFFILLLLGNTIAPNLSHLATLSTSPSSGISSPPFPDAFPGLSSGLTCSTGR